MSLRQAFEKWYGTQNKVFQDTFSKAEKGERDRYYYDRVESGWQGFQAGHAAGLEAAQRLRDATSKLIEQGDLQTVRLFKDFGQLIDEKYADASNKAIDALAAFDKETT